MLALEQRRGAALDRLAAHFAAGHVHEETLVGRSRACDVVLADPAVSRRHALISVRGDRCSIRNLASMNGTHVNGRPITTAVLHAGDVVCFAGAVDALVR